MVAGARRNIRTQLQDTPYRLSILGVGTDEGAPIPSGQSGFARDRQNNIIIARLNGGELQQLAHQTGGRYHRITNDNRDLDWLLSQPSALEQQSREVERQFDNWYDRGHWLVLLLLPLALYCFRRGVLMALLLCGPLLTLYPGTSHAFSWSDLWLTSDQQAQRELEQGNAEQAAQRFETPEWKGSAQYRAGDYEGAVDTFAKLDTPQAHYNRGNALAQAGRLDEALSAYDQALQYNPDWEDANFNRALVEQLLQQQEQQGGDEGDQQDSDENQQGDGDSQPQDSEDNRDGKPGDQDTSRGQDPQDDPLAPEPSADKPEPSADKSEPSADEAQDSEQQNDKDQRNSGDGEELPAEAELSEELQDAEDLGEEERQALEQWLRRVPDDPGGLLRRKFEYQHQQQRLQRMRGNWQPPAPDSEERW
jgi:Ca-activated chloride channel family protein